MYRGMQAFDTGTGRALTNAQAEEAADNPFIYTWVEWR